MSALFLIKATDDSVAMVVRARCLSCARQVAVDNCGTEGTEIWRNPTKTTVSLIDTSGKPGAVMRVVGQ